jgi:hypothetical protein
LLNYCSAVGAGAGATGGANASALVGHCMNAASADTCATSGDGAKEALRKEC